METHYTQNMGETTYTYGVNLEEHKKVIEKQQKRIAELEQKCLLYEKEMLNCSQLENGMSLCIVQKQRIVELEQELAELKEKAIVPRFKIGQRVWWIDKRLNNYNEKEYEIVSYLIDSIVVTNKQFRYYGNDGYWHGDDELYATEQEAQEKLKEIQGNE